MFDWKEKWMVGEGKEVGRKVDGTKEEKEGFALNANFFFDIN